MFYLHDQPLVYWTLLHQTSALLTLPVIFLLLAWAVISTRNSKKAHLKGKSREREDKPVSCCFWKNKGLEDLNGLYTDQKIYDTIIPGALAFALVLQSLCWWEMWWEMGWYSLDNLPADLHHPHHAMLTTMIRDISGSAFILVLASFAGRVIEGYSGKVGQVQE
eukprot:TRINITY_DN1082_c0_g1_i6.p1 TRINITY_DN1082_c0_g1~~TRINITY_DN1082_c0_g1_i6.p1  ORF type:complete len:164 (-),score=36.32 TRINITY_DN1082_c0_g1_i6:40-531(-)